MGRQAGGCLSLLVLLQCVLLAASAKDLPPATSKFLERIRSNAKKKNSAGLVIPEWCQAESYLGEGEPSSTTMIKGPDGYFKVYKNILHHQNKWYAVHDSTVNATQIEDGASVNVGLVKLPADDAETFIANLNLCYIPGNTLLVDFPFPAFPDNLGHFAEIMLPIFSMLKGTAWKMMLHGDSTTVDTILLTNLRRPMLEWFMEVLNVAVQPGTEEPGSFSLPDIIDATSLEHYNKLGWLTFENLIVLQDRYTHPHLDTGFAAHDHGDMWKHQGCERYVSAHWKVGFAEPAHAAAFRELAYQRVKWQPPSSLPRIITYFMYPADNPPITNSYELQDMLFAVSRQVGWEFRTVSLTMEAPFVSHLAMMAETGVLVARHGPLLADAVFLPPGAMVMELLPYKWEWQQISRLYYNMTQSTNALHHFGWRPLDSKHCTYAPVVDNRNEARYKNWTPDECTSRECLVVHAKAGLVVDLDHIKQVLLQKIPLLEKGVPVEELREPWPPAA